MEIHYRRTPIGELLHLIVLLLQQENFQQEDSSRIPLNESGENHLQWKFFSECSSIAGTWESSNHLFRRPVQEDLTDSKSDLKAG